MERKSKTLALAVATAMAAGAAQANATLWEGGYGGLGLGFAKEKYVSGVVSVESTAGSSFALFGGYNVAMSDQFVVGGELTLTSAETEFTSTWSETFNDTALRVRGGYVLDEFLLYGALGYHLTHLSDNGGWSASDVGLSIGFGVEMFMSPDISVRGEYTLTGYRNVPGTGGYDLETSILTIGGAYHF